MDCPHCGAPNQTGRFCMRCRKRIAEGAAVAALPSARPAAPGASTPAALARPVVIDRLATFNLIQAAFASVYLVVAPSALVLLVAGPMVVFLLATALGVRALKPWGRALEIAVAALTLLGVPLGTILGIFLLVYLFKPEVKVVFSGKPPARLSPAERQIAARARNLWKPLAVVLGAFNILFILVLAGTAVAVVLPRFLK